MNKLQLNNLTHILHEYGRGVTVISKKSSKGRQLLEKYSTAELLSLEQFYKRPSVNALRVYSEIQSLCYDLQGYGLKVYGVNSFSFTVGFMTDDVLVVFTKKNIYVVY